MAYSKAMLQNFVSHWTARKVPGHDMQAAVRKWKPIPSAHDAGPRLQVITHVTLLISRHCLQLGYTVSKGRTITEKKSWKIYVEEADVTYFNVLSLHKYEVADKIRTDLSLSCSIFEIRNSWIQCNKASQPNATFVLMYAFTHLKVIDKIF